ncbi:AraC family transcriptional regulator [Neorhizobium sp. R1-B]|uniref:helix-turn-helix domain-containing protein n=1 Tax=Neorhizobium TaxID=1525371 RepID=UPI000CF8D9A5|nr:MULTISPECIES: helix-turn-helix domain-containing protein [Neorhizobium]TCV73679.1 AraC family transcriptional regulator [Neorhizobium sp. S3-V5DH]TDX85585.1 AraC family transcriptional regulator [Neorhizobium sp. R1-B]
MDEIEGSVLAGIPMGALALTLTRSTIRMQHSHTWGVDKSNSVHDLIICLTGSARYEVEDETIDMAPGRAMLLPAGVRFVGYSTSTEPYTGIAQHFTLDLFGRLDMIAQMNLRKAVTLARWDMMQPLTRYYHDNAPPYSTTLLQHHLFMFLLIEFIEQAHIGWKEQSVGNVNNPDALSFSVMVAASQIAADPLNDEIVERAVGAVPYNSDYFKREFRKRVGWTPDKYQEFKRMERAMGLMAGGCSVKRAAELSGYSDAYYFSRMFKRYIGISPLGYQQSERRSREGAFPRGEEDGQLLYPLTR